jgi:YgiT-type zinc finger domain-containing protein
VKPQKEKSLCPLCGGRKVAAETTFTVDFEKGLLIVRHVPAMRCVQCGEEWLSPETAQELERLAEEAKAKKTELQVTRL